MINVTSIYDFKIEGIEGQDIKLDDFRDKKLIIVNVASYCGFTGQYAQLEELFLHHKDQLNIIGFPCNDFGNQEPGSEEEILQFCETNYDITFPLTQKITISGDGVHPIYQWLQQKELNGHLDSEVTWNFTKYLIDEQGQIVRCLPSSITPLDEIILNWINS